MKTIYLYLAVFAIASAFFVSCHKDEKLMDRMEGNWKIEKSVVTYHYANGDEQVVENMDNAGTLIVSEGSSDLEKNYDLFYVNVQGDTLRAKNVMVTDEYRTRMMMMNAISDSLGDHPIVWSIEKQKRNKQIWSTYGVDSTLFYPANNDNPGAAGNWVYWQITLKRD